MLSRFPILLVTLLSMASLAFGFMRSTGLQSKAALSRRFSSVNDVVPTGILIDTVTSSGGSTPESVISKDVDIGALLKGYKKCVLFAVPGAFTPTCSALHLPGFVNNAEAMKAKGVDAILCLSVNDRFVLKAWGESTAGFLASGVQLIADGNGEFTAALKQTKDATGGHMGLRSMRYAMIIENGVITAVNVDPKDFDKSSAEHTLTLL